MLNYFTKCFCHYIFPLGMMRIPVPPYLCKHFIWSLFFFLSFWYLNWYIVVVFHCCFNFIFLMTNIVKYLLCSFSNSTFFEELVHLFCSFVFIFILFIYLFFALSWAAPVAYGGSQARGLIGSVATGLCQSHSNMGSEQCLWPIPQLTAMPDP